MIEMNEFTENVKNEMAAVLGACYSVEARTVLKINGLTYHGLCIRQADSSISPTIPMEPYYDRFLYEGGRDEAMKGISEDILKLYRENANLPNCFNKETLNLKSYDKVKGKIMFKLINADYNKALLEQIPHRLYLDLAIVFYIALGEDERGNYAALIYNSHREMWKVSTETLYQQAMENTQRDYPATIKSITQIICGYVDCLDTESGESGDMPLFYVLSNNCAINGAGTILYENVLSGFSAEKKCDLYILPSSLHEVLLFPSDGTIDAHKLKELVEQVNRQEVSDSDRLSDSVYFYDFTKNEVSIAA